MIDRLAVGTFGLDTAKLGALLLLRWRTALRGVTRERGRVLGAAIMIVLLAPLALGVAVVTALGYRSLPTTIAAQLLAAILTALWLLWILAPMLTYRVNEGLDLSRLLIYPLRRRELTVSLLVGTLLDAATYLAVPIFTAALIGWSEGAATAFVIPALALAYGHMVLAGQIVVAGAGGLLRSRRFRDVSVILLSLLGSSCYFLQRGAFELGSRYVDPEDLVDLRILPFLQWLPPGAAARTIERAATGEWLQAGLWMAYSAILLAGAAWLWWRIIVRLTTGGGFPVLGLPRPERAREKPPGRTSTVPAVLAWLPADIAQVALKELRSVWRTPRRRVMLVQAVLMPLLLVAFFRLGGDQAEMYGSWSGLALVGYAVFANWGMSQNMLGCEGTGLPMLLLTPAPRGRVLLGKGLGIILATTGPVVVLGLAVLALAPSWLSVAGLVLALSVAPMAAGVGAVFSVYFPYPIDLERTRGRPFSASRGSCATVLANTVLLPLVTGIATLPAVALVAGAELFGLPWLGLAAVAAAAVSGVVLLWSGTQFAGRVLVGREPEVVAATRLGD